MHNIQQSLCRKEITMNAIHSCTLISRVKPMAMKKRRQKCGRMPNLSVKKMAIQRKCSADSKAVICKKKMWEKFHNAACIIQRNVKSYLMRKKWRCLVTQVRNIEEKKRIIVNKAAVVIQSWWRKVIAQKQFRISVAFKRRKNAPFRSISGTTMSPLFNGKGLAYVPRKLQSYSLGNFKELHPYVKGCVPSYSLYFHDWEAIIVLGGIAPSLSCVGVDALSLLKSDQGFIPKRGIEMDGSEILRFNPGTNEWEKVPIVLPEGRHHHSCAFLAGLIYVVGGCCTKNETESQRNGSTINYSRGGAVVGTTWALDPSNGLWKELSCLAIPRRDFCLIASNGCLYAIGGLDRNGHILASVEQYNPRNGRWSFVSSMPEPRVGHAAAKHYDLIWVAGGTSAPSPLFMQSASLLGSPSSYTIMLNAQASISDSVFIYDPRVDIWYTFVPLRFPRTHSSLFSNNDSLFLVGGATRFSPDYLTEFESHYTSGNGEIRSVGTVDILDGREWKHQAELAVPRHGHALSYLGTQLVVIGGISTTSNAALTRVECFCSERKRWLSNVAFLPKSLCGLAAISLPPATLM